MPIFVTVDNRGKIEIKEVSVLCTELFNKSRALIDTHNHNYGMSPVDHKSDALH